MEKEGNRSDRPMVSAEFATKHRAAVARVVYLAQDRLDVGVAAVELAKTMAIPREGDNERLKRVARYLHGNPDYVQWYPLQEETNTVVLSTDADWATCRETRRSNSGGTVMLGNHLIAVWSRVQPRLALSSGEAELYAGLRGITETLGFVHMMREFHTQDWGRIIHRVDASACRAIMLRRGCGGLKHITVKSLWVQEAVRDYSITIERVSRDVMHAHFLASPSTADELTRHLTELKGFRSTELEDAHGERDNAENLGTEVQWLVELESRALVPWDLVKLDFGGVVLADGAVLDGILIQAVPSE